MKLKSWASNVLIILATAIGLIAISPALAQVVATTTNATSSPIQSTSTPAVEGSSTSTVGTSSPSTAGTATSSSAVATTSASNASYSVSSTPSPVAATTTSSSTPVSSVATPGPAASPSPQPLTLVHIVGTKYIDYFTDGKKTYSFPGDASIDAKLGSVNPQNPTHTGLTWTGTSGTYLYDTSSGDLEVGDYAQQSDGSYIVNRPASTYTSATSTTAIAAHVETVATNPTI